MEISINKDVLSLNTQMQLKKSADKSSDSYQKVFSEVNKASENTVAYKIDSKNQVKVSDISKENVSASSFSIQDAYNAQRMMSITKAQAFQKPSQAVLAQANLNPDIVEDLLK